jgi:ribosome-associated toxin RatA of RatAB toxin-antitoxin module
VSDVSSVDIEMTMNAPLPRVWEAMVDVSSFPKFMNAVNDTQILDQVTNGRRTTAWSVMLKGSLLKWTERDDIDENSHSINFCQIKGDLDRFEGTWRATELDSDSVHVHLHAEFDIGIPLLTDMLTPVAAQALRESHEEILESIQQRASE